ncbi:diguanylate cyclase (GGDEF) domain-containing protein [Modicisalibacter muralis]|uniref:diguanylate cyclase n=1 Tax=Modicisalibacter muralis TaxID=119000 RepID=A0A1G9FS60_9GAMM|nr:diguanylate cyclase (GGDEF) domain-containing protein [Halomonas muralis]
MKGACLISDALRKSLDSCPALPSLPAAVLRLIELARSSETRLQPIIEALSKDPALTARLISLANTAFYTKGHPAEELREAVERLGLDTTVSLALGFSLASGYGNDAQRPGLDLHRYWQRSLTSAIASQELARQSALESSGGAIFTAALLQDIGMLALDAVEGPHYDAVIGNADRHDDISLRERTEFGAAHAEIGAWLAANWGLSPRACDWIRRSHDRPVRDALLDEGECVMLSGRLADIWLEADGHNTLAQLEPWLGDEQCRSDLLSRIQARLPMMAELFDVATPGYIDPHTLLFQAKQLLLERTLKLQQILGRKEKELDELRHDNAQLDQAVRYDPLTRLYNRQHLTRVLQERFFEAQRDEQSLVVIFIDLDYFKQINDEHGHHLGDQVLKAFAELLRTMSEKGMTIGRYGGEEFLVIMKGYTPQHAWDFANRLCEQLRVMPLAHYDDKAIHVTASVGIANLGDGDFETPDDLIHIADQRMYLSKRQGRNRITAS